MEDKKEAALRMMEHTAPPQLQENTVSQSTALVQSAAMVVLVIALDQWSKEVFFGERAGSAGALNPGVSFGIGSSLAGQEMNLFLIVLAVTIAWWQRAYFVKHPLLAGLFFGGVFSNILDRIQFGAVRDWLPVPGLQLYNNLADWAIFASWALFLGVALIKRTTHDSEK
jgi:lipoprotein signal peptidase